MRVIVFVLVVVLIAVGIYFRECQLLHRAQHKWSKTVHKMSNHESLLARIEARPKRPVPRGSFPKARPAAKALLAVHWQNPKRAFYTTPRTPHIERYPCSGCHNGPMKGNTTRFRATHSDIVLKHASLGVLQCKSCHNSQDMNKLRTPSGVVVSMNRSYLLCGSCHARQANDWAGGAHGKRETYWAGKRVVRTCTGCHNPHKPLFGKRWPKTHFRPPIRKLQR